MFLGINTKPRLTNTQGKPQWPPKGGEDDVLMHIIIVWHFLKRIYKTVPLSNGHKWDMFSAVFFLYTPKYGDVRILLGMMLLHMLVTCNTMSHFEVTESNLDDKFWLHTIGIVGRNLRQIKTLSISGVLFWVAFVVAVKTIIKLQSF